MEQVFSTPAETVASIEELLVEILLRVPADTLIRFKRVSKHWLSLISSPSFLNSHAKCVHNKTLYICSSEKPCRRFNQYRVQAIKYNDLFSFSDTPSKITIYPFTAFKSRSKSTNSSVLREVAIVSGYDLSVPCDMSFAVHRYRIVLAGGWLSGRYNTRIPSYVLQTDPEARFVSSMIPDMEGFSNKKNDEHFLQEIDGMLYALSKSKFAVFHPRKYVWLPLPPLPVVGNYFEACSALGSKIFATVTYDRIRTRTFCFDVASPHRKWTQLDRSAIYNSKQNLVLDSEDKSAKLLFTSRYRRILIHRILLSNEGEPNKFELVASIDLPELPSLSECMVTSYSCVHLGDGKVCFSFSYRKLAAPEYSKLVLVLTIEFAYSKSGASSPFDISCSSTSDSNYLSYTSISGSFSAKALGCHLFEFEYNYSDGSPFYSDVFGGCFDCFLL